MKPPLFSIIVVHYQGVVPHNVFCRGIASLRVQTFGDFEILCYHDGPLLDPTVQMPVPVTCMEKRFADWGHSLRDRGIREATGEYIVHFNADNVLYPNALEAIAREIARPPRMILPNGRPTDANDMIIFPIKMFGLLRVARRVRQFRDTSFYEILTGNPPIEGNIDCMQLVMKRDLWLKEGGWHDKSEHADGHLYSAFAEKYLYRTVGPVLGEHY